MSMQYYFRPHGNGKGSVHRVNFQTPREEPFITDSWKDGEWQDNPKLIDLAGFSSNADNYKQITKAEADKMIEDDRAV